MSPNGYKFIRVTPEYEIAIPKGLPPEQEAALIAQRLAEIDRTALARECKDLEDLRAHPENAIPIEDIIRDLESMGQAPSNDVP